MKRPRCAGLYYQSDLMQEPKQRLPARYCHSLLPQAEGGCGIKYFLCCPYTCWDMKCYVVCRALIQLWVNAADNPPATSSSITTALCAASTPSRYAREMRQLVLQSAVGVHSASPPAPACASDSSGDGKVRASRSGDDHTACRLRHLHITSHGFVGNTAVTYPARVRDWCP